VDRAGLILFTLTAMQFISTADFMIVMPLGPLRFDTLGIDTVQFSWVVSAYTFAAGCAGVAAAAVLDRRRLQCPGDPTDRTHEIPSSQLMFPLRPLSLRRLPKRAITPMQ
jgi:MFS family permease